MNLDAAGHVPYVENIQEGPSKLDVPQNGDDKCSFDDDVCSLLDLRVKRAQTSRHSGEPDSSSASKSNSTPVYHAFVLPTSEQMTTCASADLSKQHLHHCAGYFRCCLDLFTGPSINSSPRSAVCQTSCEDENGVEAAQIGSRDSSLPSTTPLDLEGFPISAQSSQTQQSGSPELSRTDCLSTGTSDFQEQQQISSHGTANTLPAPDESSPTSPSHHNPLSKGIRNEETLSSEKSVPSSPPTSQPDRPARATDSIPSRPERLSSRPMRRAKHMHHFNKSNLNWNLSVVSSKTPTIGASTTSSQSSSPKQISRQQEQVVDLIAQRGELLTDFPVALLPASPRKIGDEPGRDHRDQNDGETVMKAARSIVGKRLAQQHRYAAMRDAAQTMLAQLAEARGVVLEDLLEEYSIGKDDGCQ